MEGSLISKNIYFSSNEPKPNIVAIFSHSLSNNHESNLIKEISKKLKDNNIGIISYDFSFAKNKTKPSVGLLEEVNELDFVVSTVKKKLQPKNIVLIGTSLGGIVSAIYCSKNAYAEIQSLFILGFPFKLGFPPNFQLLEEENPILPDYISEYKNLFELITIPTGIIQGDQDDLGGAKECEDFFKQYKKCTLNVIKGASHGFVSAQDKSATYYDECARLIIEKIFDKK